MASPSPAFKVNGGAVGADTSVTAGSTVSATLNSTDGVRIVAWSIARTDDTGTPGAYTLTPSGALGETVSFTAGAAGTAVALQCVINAGIDAQTEAASDAYTATAKIYVPLGGSSLEVLVAGELEDGNTESSATHGGVKPINAGIRKADTANAAVQAATAAATPSTLALRGGSADCAFGNVSAGTNPATTGNLREANNGGHVARNAANGANVLAIKVDGSDNIVLGGDSTGASLGGRDIQLRVPTGQAVKLYVNGSLITTLSESGATGIITTSGSMWLSSAGTLTATAVSYFDVEANGTVYLSSAVAGGTPTFEFRGVGDAGVEKWTRTTVQTTDATVTTVASFTLTDATIYNVVADVRGLVTGGNGAGYLRAATVKRIGAGAVLVAVSTPHTAEDNAAWDCTIDVNGNDARVRVTGAAATTINWSCLLKVTQ